MLDRETASEIERQMERWCSAYRDEDRFCRDLLALDARRARVAEKADVARSEQEAANDALNSALASVREEDEEEAKSIVRRYLGEAQIDSLVDGDDE